MNDEESEDYTAEAVNTGCSVLIAGMVFVIIMIMILTLLGYAVRAQAPVKLQVEPFIPADTCALVYDMTGFSGNTLYEYIGRMDRFTRRDGLFFLFSPQLLAMYRVQFKPRKACLSDLLDQAVSGTDLTWKCEGRNILIWRE